MGRLGCQRESQTIEVNDSPPKILMTQNDFDSVILGTANIQLMGNGSVLFTRALCDNGSQVNLITSSMKKLNPIKLRSKV